MSSHDTADLFHLINDSLVYVLRIGMAIFFLAPLGQGDFDAAKRRFLQWGIPVLIAAFFGGAQWLFTNGLDWIVTNILQSAYVRTLVPHWAGAVLDHELMAQLPTFALNVVLLGGIIWIIRHG